ncbi:elongation factor P [Treponema zioleckii]|uniref:elongation factor P n=1 Tax=Treponema zioleckii TaxID=331680 RepID=UPI00168AD2BA|nr:elongation factor P [Treponema zioleckii]
MGTIVTNEIKVGTAFMCENEPLIVQKKLGQKGGRQGITVNLRVKNIVTGSTKDLGVDAGDKFQEIELEKKAVKLSYVDGDDYHFMDDNWEEVVLSKEDLGDNAGYIKPSEAEGDDDDYSLEITYYEGKAVGIDLPIRITRKITYCEPGIKGDTSGKSSKPATLDTGIEVMVPLFCSTDDRIVIDTRDGSFVERAKDK